MSLTKKQKVEFAQFQELVKSAEGGIVYVNPDVVAPFIKANLIEINNEFKDADGRVAARLTPAQTAPAAEIAHDATAAEVEVSGSGEIITNAVATAPEVVHTDNTITVQDQKVFDRLLIGEKHNMTFKIDNDVEVPKVGGRGSHSTGRRSPYPIDDLEVNQSFFVEATAEMEKPERSLAPVLTHAKNRYAIPDPSGAMRVNQKKNTVPVVTFTRMFIVRRVEENGKVGARVWRTA